MAGIFREGMDVPQDIDGASVPRKKKSMRKKAPRVKLPALRSGEMDAPMEPDDGSVGMRKGGGVKEYGGKEVYKSKAAKARHEKAESPAKERSEKRGYAKGGSVRGDGCATRGKTKGRMV